MSNFIEELRQTTGCTMDSIERANGMTTLKTKNLEGQRQKLYDYLGDTVSEFVSSDDGVDPEDFVLILKNVLTTEYEYYQRQADKNKKVLNLLNYNVG